MPALPKLHTCINKQYLQIKYHTVRPKLMKCPEIVYNIPDNLLSELLISVDTTWLYKATIMLFGQASWTCVLTLVYMVTYNLAYQTLDTILYFTNNRIGIIMMIDSKNNYRQTIHLMFFRFEVPYPMIVVCSEMLAI